MPKASGFRWIGLFVVVSLALAAVLLLLAFPKRPSPMAIQGLALPSSAMLPPAQRYTLELSHLPQSRQTALKLRLEVYPKGKPSLALLSQQHTLSRGVTIPLPLEFAPPHEELVLRLKPVSSRDSRSGSGWPLLAKLSAFKLSSDRSIEKIEAVSFKSRTFKSAKPAARRAGMIFAVPFSFQAMDSSHPRAFNELRLSYCAESRQCAPLALRVWLYSSQGKLLVQNELTLQTKKEVEIGALLLSASGGEAPVSGLALVETLQPPCRSCELKVFSRRRYPSGSAAQGPQSIDLAGEFVGFRRSPLGGPQAASGAAGPFPSSAPSSSVPTQTVVPSPSQTSSASGSPAVTATQAPSLSPQPSASPTSCPFGSYGEDFTTLCSNRDLDTWEIQYFCCHKSQICTLNWELDPPRVVCASPTPTPTPNPCRNNAPQTKPCPKPGGGFVCCKPANGCPTKPGGPCVTPTPTPKPCSRMPGRPKPCPGSHMGCCRSTDTCGLMEDGRPMCVSCSARCVKKSTCCFGGCFKEGSVCCQSRTGACDKGEQCCHKGCIPGGSYCCKKGYCGPDTGGCCAKSCMPKGAECCGEKGYCGPDTGGCCGKGCCPLGTYCEMGPMGDLCVMAPYV